MAENILLPEEKKYLGKVSRYLGSLGMKYGDINFEMEPDDEQISYGENIFQLTLTITILQKFQTDLYQY
jgi:hypothetical protein